VIPYIFFAVSTTLLANWLSKNEQSCWKKLEVGNADSTLSQTTEDIVSVIIIFRLMLKGPLSKRIDYCSFSTTLRAQLFGKIVFFFFLALFCSPKGANGKKSISANKCARSC